MIKPNLWLQIIILFSGGHQSNTVHHKLSMDMLQNRSATPLSIFQVGGDQYLLHTSWQIVGETMETVRDFIFIFLAPKSLQMVTTAMKLKDACSLEEKL